MAIRREIVVCLRLVVVLLLVWGATPASAGSVLPVGKASTETGISVDRFMAELRQRGFEVAEGGFQLWRIEDCPQSYDVMGTCYFNNPTAPYVMAVVPYWPDEYVDPATQGAFGATDAGYGTTFRLDPTEAVVIFGRLPPRAAYFAIQSYLFTRKGEYQTGNDTYRFIHYIGAADVFFHKVPGNPERIATFDSLSNSNNNVVIERQSGASFDQLRYFIITPDQYMDKQVRQGLHKLSVADEDIFTERIPSNMRIGLDADADDFVSGIRYSMPDDGGDEGTPSSLWRNSPTLTLLRIRDTRPNREPRRYPAWKDDDPEPRTAVGENELESDPGDPHRPPERYRAWEERYPACEERFPAWEDDSPESRTAEDEHWLKPNLGALLRQVR